MPSLLNQIISVAAFLCFFQPTLATPTVVGLTPAFIPAVKRCFVIDSVPCFKEVFEYFKNHRKVQDRHRAQLPALAAQLGAVKIFKHLQTILPSPTVWLSRAAARQQWTFFNTFAPASWNPNPVDLNPKYEMKERLDLYRSSVISTYHLKQKPIKELTSLKMTARDLLFFRLHPGLGWLSPSFASLLYNQTYLPPVEYIWQVLAMPDSQEKIHYITQLKDRIKRLLNNGTYLMDDVLPDPNIIVSLWLNHYNVESSTSPNNDLLDFFLDEGAPIDDHQLIEVDYSKEMKKYGKPDSAYTKLVHKAVKYASGFGTNALVREIQYHVLLKEQIYRYRDTFGTYKRRADADVLSPVVLHQVVLYWCEFTDDWSLVRSLFELGLTETHVAELKPFAAQLPEKQKERYEREVRNLLHRLQSMKEDP